MDDEDIQAFFQQVDAYEYRSVKKTFNRLSWEYKVMFKLIYCCGLRNSEACELEFRNIDTVHGIITIIHSKGDKDRLVYLANDLREVCDNYKKQLIYELGTEPQWFFPGNSPEKHIIKTSVDRKFNEIWNRTEKSHDCIKKPTVHCLRYGFVIKRMNQWMENDVDFKVMMPYLSHYLGHKSPKETYYYYHQVEESFRTIRRKDRIAADVIPEVEHV